jgi:hypothetical protein
VVSVWIPYLVVVVVDVVGVCYAVEGTQYVLLHHMSWHCPQQSSTCLHQVYYLKSLML